MFEHSCRSGKLMPAVGKIGRTGAFRGNHRGTQGILWCTLLAERGAVVRLLEALQDQAADANSGFLRVEAIYFKDAFGIVIVKLGPQPVAALWNSADSAPLAITDLESLVDQTFGGR